MKVLATVNCNVVVVLHQPWDGDARVGDVFDRARREAAAYLLNALREGATVVPRDVKLRLDAEEPSP
jgi:hypothetical protein